MSEIISVPDSPELRGKDWWDALRLAYQIPPIVKDANALTHLGAVFPTPDNIIKMDDGQSIDLGKVAMLALVDAGEAGQLDELLLAEQSDDSTIKKALTPAVAKYINGVDTSQDEATKRAVLAFQDEAIKRAMLAFKKMRPELTTLRGN